MNHPILTVVMLIYNGEKYLQEAIDSIINQTFTDFEFIIINDGSTDNSINIIKSYADKRINLINNATNKGIPYCRNLGLREAKGHYLAWSDCDDVNHPKRFEYQIKYLSKHPHHGICGSRLVRFGEAKKYTGRVDYDSDIIKARLLFKTSICNATAMYRMSKIREFDLQFKTDFPIAEDYEFYFQCSKYFPMSNIDKVLYKYRASESSISKRYKSNPEIGYDIRRKIYQAALKYLGINAKEEEIRTHSLIGSEELFETFDDYKKCTKWLKRLCIKNDETQTYANAQFKKVVADQFYFISKKASKFGLITLQHYFINCITTFKLAGVYNVAKLGARCIIKYNKF